MESWLVPLSRVQTNFLKIMQFKREQLPNIQAIWKTTESLSVTL